MTRLVTRSLLAFILISLLSFALDNDYKIVERIIKDLWNGEAKYENIGGSLSDKSNSLNEYFDPNNELYTINNGITTQGIVCLRENHTPPFSNWTGRNKSDAIYTTNRENTYDAFRYALTLDKNLTVKDLRILRFRSEYGIEIQSKRWLKQFRGYDGSQELEYGKSIDAVTGATISAKELISDFQATYSGLRSFYGKISEGPN